MAGPLTTRPLRLTGPWKQGYALDFHTASSTYKGDDEFGHPVFETIRTPLGEALYKLKYSRDRSVIPVIAATVSNYLKARDWQVDGIVPVPPSNARRTVQPVREIAHALGKLAALPVCDACLIKRKSTPPLKDVFDRSQRERFLSGAFLANPQLTAGKSLLLLDDLYRSGATAATAARELLDGGKAKAVYFIAVTRTRTHG